MIAAAPLVFANCSADSGNGGGSSGAAATSGGALSSGGATSGGATSGGATSGGATSGGAMSGGATSGGATSGGSNSAGAAGHTAGAGGNGGPGGGMSGGGMSGGGMSGGGMSGAGRPGGGAGPGGGNAGGGSGTAGSAGTANGGGGNSGGTFKVTSPDMMDGDKFAPEYTCAGQNGKFGTGANPELDWSGVPANTMSFAITFIDTTIGEDMQMGQHWAIWNIPASVMKLPHGMTMLMGDYAMAKQSGTYLAPCATMLKNGMDDEYEFTVWALSSATLDVQGTTVANALKALHAVTPLGKATFHGHAGLQGK